MTRGRRRGGRRSGRQKPSRDARPTVAIWCEGRKTEVAYFRALKKDEGLSNTVVAGCSNIPDLMRRTENAIRENTMPDQVWYVIDHDEREKEIKKFCNWVQEQKKSLSKKRRRQTTELIVVLSVPCFEYWLLIHFEDTTRPFRGLEGRSACQQVIQALTKYIPKYKKNDPTVYDLCRDKREHAIEYGRRNADSIHSRTDVWKLVSRLCEMAS